MIPGCHYALFHVAIPFSLCARSPFQPVCLSVCLSVRKGNRGLTGSISVYQVGFDLIDALGRAEGIAVTGVQEVSAVGSGRIAGRRVLLVKPLTFMNNSGEAVKRLSRYYKVGD
jgi:peptidyl-tRNA hydrolase